MVDTLQRSQRDEKQLPRPGLVIYFSTPALEAGTALPFPTTPAGSWSPGNLPMCRGRVVGTEVGVRNSLLIRGSLAGPWEQEAREVKG